MSIYNIDEFWRHSLLLDFKRNWLIIIIVLLLDLILLYVISLISLPAIEPQRRRRALAKTVSRFIIGGIYSISLGGLLVYALIGTTPEIFGYFESPTFRDDFMNVVKKRHKDFYSEYLRYKDYHNYKWLIRCLSYNYVETAVNFFEENSEGNISMKAIHKCLKEEKNTIFSLIVKIVYFGSLLAIMIGIFSTGIVDIFKKGP